MDRLTVLKYINNNRALLFPNSKYTEQELTELLIQSNPVIDLNTAQIPYKSPTTALVISIIFGYCGTDRIYLGDKFLPILKFFTLGCCGIWYILDFFLIQRKCRTINCDMLLNVLCLTGYYEQAKASAITGEKAKDMSKKLAPVLKDGVKSIRKTAKNFTDTL